jgi:hypothetical protein
MRAPRGCAAAATRHTVMCHSAVTTDRLMQVQQRLASACMRDAGICAVLVAASTSGSTPPSVPRSVHRWDGTRCPCTSWCSELPLCQRKHPEGASPLPVAMVPEASAESQLLLALVNTVSIALSACMKSRLAVTASRQVCMSTTILLTSYR